MININREVFQKIVGLLIPLMHDEDERKTIVETALYGCTVLDDMNWEGSSRTFCQRLVRQLINHGECEEGQPSLLMLLEHCKNLVGVNIQKNIDSIILRIVQQSANDATPQPPSDLTVITEAEEPSQQRSAITERQAETSAPVQVSINNHTPQTPSPNPEAASSPSNRTNIVISCLNSAVIVAIIGGIFSLITLYITDWLLTQREIRNQNATQTQSAIFRSETQVAIAATETRMEIAQQTQTGVAIVAQTESAATLAANQTQAAIAIPTALPTPSHLSVALTFQNCPQEIRDALDTEVTRWNAEGLSKLDFADANVIVGSDVQVDCDIEQSLITIQMVALNQDYSVLSTVPSGWVVIAEPIQVELAADTSVRDVAAVVQAMALYFNRGRFDATDLARLDNAPDGADVCLLRGNIYLRLALRNPTPHLTGVVRELSPNRLADLWDAVNAYQCATETLTDERLLNNQRIAAYFGNELEEDDEELVGMHEYFSRDDIASQTYPFVIINDALLDLFSGPEKCSDNQHNRHHGLLYLCRAFIVYRMGVFDGEPPTDMVQQIEDANDAYRRVSPLFGEASLLDYSRALVSWCVDEDFAQAQNYLSRARLHSQQQLFVDEILEYRMSWAETQLRDELRCSF